MTMESGQEARKRREIREAKETRTARPGTVPAEKQALFERVSSPLPNVRNSSWSISEGSHSVCGASWQARLLSSEERQEPAERSAAHKNRCCRWLRRGARPFLPAFSPPRLG